jgi:hypothetical protein
LRNQKAIGLKVGDEFTVPLIGVTIENFSEWEVRRLGGKN